MIKTIAWFIGVLMFVAGLSAAPWTTAVAAAPTCRNTYASTNGAWGSARICYAPSGKGWYKTTLKGTIKDTGADNKRAALFVGYTMWAPPPINAGRNSMGDTQRLATANHKGATQYAAWNRDDVKNVSIFVCTVDRFGVKYNCSKNR